MTLEAMSQGGADLPANSSQEATKSGSGGQKKPF